jgi:hypothetical protein
MFDQLLQPILKKVHPATIEEVRSSKQKELRIIDTMEPLLNQHRLVFDKTMVKKDIEGALTDAQKLPYSLIYQMTHITRQRGCLRHDDRLDALSIGLQQLVETVGVDEDDMVKDYREEQLDATLDKWMDDMESWIPGAAGSR